MRAKDQTLDIYNSGTVLLIVILPNSFTNFTQFGQFGFFLCLYLQGFVKWIKIIYSFFFLVLTKLEHEAFILYLPTRVLPDFEVVIQNGRVDWRAAGELAELNVECPVKQICRTMKQPEQTSRLHITCNTFTQVNTVRSKRGSWWKGTAVSSRCSLSLCVSFSNPSWRLEPEFGAVQLVP